MMLGQTRLQGSMAAYNYNLTLLLTFTIIRIDSYRASKSRDPAFNKKVDWNAAFIHCTALGKCLLEIMMHG